MAETIKHDSPPDAATSETGTPENATGGDRRVEERRGADRRDHVRIRPDDKNQLAATLASGSNIRLIDLSRGGAQFECDRRFLPNATVSLRLLTSDGEVLVTGRVVRSRIVRLGSGGLGYMVAVAFTKLLQTELEDAAAVPETAAPEAAAPAHRRAETPAVPEPAATAPAVPATEPAERAAEPAAPLNVPDLPEHPEADITAEEALAFEATIEIAPAMLTVTASVDTTSEQLHDMFDGNDW